MKALCVTPDRTLTVREVPAPSEPQPEHVLIRMEACTINPGDKYFLSAPPVRNAPQPLHGTWGASGAGTVIAAGAGVPASWVGRKVAVYRSLVPSEHTLGTWAEVAQMPMRTCALIPEGLDARDYSGSLVNVMTAYAFAKLVLAEGHRGALVTAGTSATGIALLGVARALGVSIVTIARDKSGEAKLRALGAEDVLVQSDAGFEAALTEATERKKATAVFDGVGGALLSRIVPHIAQGTTVYTYGYLGAPAPFTLASTALLLTKNLTLRGFSNFMTPTVRDPQALDAALARIGELLALPHCKTPAGRTFSFDQIEEALATVGTGEGKPVLVP